MTGTELSAYYDKQPKKEVIGVMAAIIYTTITTLGSDQAVRIAFELADEIEKRMDARVQEAIKADAEYRKSGR